MSLGDFEIFFHIEFSCLIYRFWLFFSNIYFFSDCWSGCSKVAASDGVADVAVAAAVHVAAFVACYCHLPRSLHKHGASLEAPYPLHIHHSSWFKTAQVYWRCVFFIYIFFFLLLLNQVLYNFLLIIVRRN